MVRNILQRKQSKRDLMMILSNMQSGRRYSLAQQKKINKLESDISSSKLTTIAGLEKRAKSIGNLGVF